MPANPALPIRFTLLISLFPLAMYCLMLSSINRRSEPLLVRGVWDFTGLLFAVSGMLLWAGPAMMATIFERSIFGGSSKPFEELVKQWWLLWVSYYGVVLSGSILLLWLRRPTTAIYNVQPDLVPTLVAAALHRLGLDFAQNAHDQFLIAPTKRPALRPTGSDGEFAEAIAPGTVETLPRAVEAAPRPYSSAVEIDQSPSLCHATLHWYETDARLRIEIEGELQKNLTNARPADNPAGVWQFGVGVLLFGAIFMSLIFFVLSALWPRY